MSATDDLRRLLDERGVEWYEPTMKPNTTWIPDAHGFNCRVTPWGDALCVKRYGLTPEQAIAATLGGGEMTCHVERSDCFECSECAFFDAYAAPSDFNYCPNCGAKVVER